MPKDIILECRNCSLGYARDKPLIAGLNLAIYKNDFLGVIGPNGCGKTTLLRSLMGLLKPQAGDLIRAKNIPFGYCKQRQFIDTLFPVTVFEMVMMARTKFIKPFRAPGHIDRKSVEESLKVVGILNLRNERFYNLSGGQKQRVLIARALALGPDVLILDEPTTDLDIKGEREILKLVENLHKQEKFAVILVTHELNEIINYAQRFIFLNTHLPPKIVAKNGLSEELLSEIFDTPIKLSQVNGKTSVF